MHSTHGAAQPLIASISGSGSGSRTHNHNDHNDDDDDGDGGEVVFPHPRLGGRTVYAGQDEDDGQDEDEEEEEGVEINENRLISPSVFVWCLTLCAGVSGLLFGYE